MQFKDHLQSYLNMTMVQIVYATYGENKFNAGHKANYDSS